MSETCSLSLDRTCGALSTKLDPVFKTTVLVPTSICPVSSTSRLQEPSGCGILVPGTPGDLAATIYRHMDVPLDATYLDPRGRPRYVVEEGQPIAELS